MSFAAWALPFSGRRGFENPEPLTLAAISFVIVWYVGIAGCATLGYSITRSSSSPISPLNGVDSDAIYRVLSVLALIGVALTYSAASGNRPSVILDAFRNQSANELKSAVYDSYSLGILTLRYVAALSGGVALFRLVSSRRLTILDAVNMLVLLAAAAVSARLLLVMGIVLCLGMIVHEKNDTRVSVRWLLVSLVAVFLVLTPLNYSRNANFYKAYYDEPNAFAMNVFEIVTYLGAPFQVSLGMANNNLEGEPDASDVQRFVVPSYLPQSEVDRSDDVTYRGVVDVEDALTTNSALAELYSAMGVVTFPFMMCVALLAGCLIGHFMNYDNYIHLSGWALVYGFSEVWRLFLFNQGVVHAVVLAPIAAAVIVLLLPRLRTAQRPLLLPSDS